MSHVSSFWSRPDFTLVAMIPGGLFLYLPIYVGPRNCMKYMVYVNRVGFLCRLWFLNIFPNFHPSFERVIHRPRKVTQHRFEAVKDFFDHCFVRGMLGTSSSSPHNKTLHVCCIYRHLPHYLPPKLPKCRQIDHTLIQFLE